MVLLGWPGVPIPAKDALVHLSTMGLREMGLEEVGQLRGNYTGNCSRIPDLCSIHSKKLSERNHTEGENLEGFWALHGL